MVTAYNNRNKRWHCLNCESREVFVGDVAKRDHDQVCQKADGRCDFVECKQDDAEDDACSICRDSDSESDESKIMVA